MQIRQFLAEKEARHDEEITRLVSNQLKMVEMAIDEFKKTWFWGWERSLEGYEMVVHRIPTVNGYEYSNTYVVMFSNGPMDPTAFGAPAGTDAFIVIFNEHYEIIRSGGFR